MSDCRKHKKIVCDCSARFSPGVTVSVIDTFPLLFPNSNDILVFFERINICQDCCLRGSSIRIIFEDLDANETFLFRITSFESVRCESFNTFGQRLIVSGTGHLRGQSYQFKLAVSQNRDNSSDIELQLINSAGQIVLDTSVRKSAAGGVPPVIVRSC